MTHPFAATVVRKSLVTCGASFAGEGLKEHILRSGEDGGSPDFFGPKLGIARFIFSVIGASIEDEASSARKSISR